MRSLGAAQHLTAGAVGVPGRRTFYLLVDGSDGREWFILEKEQLAALAVHALELVGRIPAPSPADKAAPGSGPSGNPSFRVGEIALSAEEDGVVVLLSPADEGESVAFSAGPAVLEAMAQHALQVVAAGRPLCPLCGLPMDQASHACPAGNGDLRRR